MEKEKKLCPVWINYNVGESDNPREYFLSMDVPKEIAKDLKKGYLPKQIENLIVNIALIQGFEKAEFTSVEVGSDFPLESPFDTLVSAKETDFEFLLVEALRCTAILLNNSSNDLKMCCERLQTIISSLKEVLCNE